MKCVICQKGPAEGITVFRINPIGVKGLWACRKHIGQTDAPPIDATVQLIVDAVERRSAK